MLVKYTLYLFLILSLFLSETKAQLNSSHKFFESFHPGRIFSVEISSTFGVGKSQNTFLFFDTQYSLWQRPLQFLTLNTGGGVGFMRNNFGKLASFGMPLQLVYAVGKNGHFFETSMGCRFILGYSLAEGFQVVPFIMPTIGYRYQIPKEVFFNFYGAVQYHPNLGFSPLIGVGVGYDY
jgi:hypothetical protein